MPLHRSIPDAGRTWGRGERTVEVGGDTSAVVLFLTPRPGHRIELLGAEAVGVEDGAEVRFFFSPPVVKPNGDRVIGDRLERLEGATFANPDTTTGPERTIGVVAEMTATEPGRYELTAVRLRYRINGGAEQTAEGISVVLTVCADDPAPADCPE